MRFAVNSGLFAGLNGSPSDAERARLDGLLEADVGVRSDPVLPKASPKSATKKNSEESQERLLWLESFGDAGGLLSGIPNQKVAHLAAQVRALDASELKKVGPHRRRAMLICLVHRTKVVCRDGLAEMLVKTIARIHVGARDDLLEEPHRAKRDPTESLIGVLEKILWWAPGPLDGEVPELAD